MHVRSRAATNLWRAGLNRLRQQLLVVSAFQDAAARNRNRRLTIRDITEDEAQQQRTQHIVQETEFSRKNSLHKESGEDSADVASKLNTDSLISDE